MVLSILRYVSRIHDPRTDFTRCSSLVYLWKWIHFIILHSTSFCLWETLCRKIMRRVRILIIVLFLMSCNVFMRLDRLGGIRRLRKKKNDYKIINTIKPLKMSRTLRVWLCALLSRVHCRSCARHAIKYIILFRIHTRTYFTP